jgi:uncharacterized membrane protein
MLHSCLYESVWPLHFSTARMLNPLQHVQQVLYCAACLLQMASQVATATGSDQGTAASACLYMLSTQLLFHQPI